MFLLLFYVFNFFLFLSFFLLFIVFYLFVFFFFFQAEDGIRDLTVTGVQTCALPISGLVVRGLMAAVCLLPPTILMGGSFPAIARLLETTPRGVSQVGYLYSANIDRKSVV